MANMLEVYGSHYLCTGLILCAIIIAYLCSACSSLHFSSLLGALLRARLSTEPGAAAAAHKINLNSREQIERTL